jgi:hypothetical protein
MYIVDFVCLEKKLIIEVDGGQHADSEKDRRRDAWLQGEGYEVLRFWNSEVLGSLDGVMEVIWRRCAAPSPQPLPSREGSERAWVSLTQQGAERAQASLAPERERAG